MSDPYWLVQAKTLPAGSSMRIVCCSADRSMLVSNDVRGYRGFCFRCREPMFEAHGEFSLATLARRREEFALIQSKTVELPRDFTTDIPLAEATWLFKAGISSELAVYYGIGWSARLGRIIVPVYEGGQLVAYTARMKYGKPKYIEKSIDPGGLVFRASASKILPSCRAFATEQAPDYTLVEDNLSAIRVGCVTRNAVSLMGTSANPRQIAKALDGHSLLGMGRTNVRVAVWLDPDKPGRSASATLCPRLRLLGYEVREILTDRDPKFYSAGDIKEILT